MKKILGLDLGTNSIGWAVINGETDENNELKLTNISATGSRIIPMTEDKLGAFGKGVTESATSARTKMRGVRRLYERKNLRRERLIRVLKKMGWLPAHYAQNTDEYGHFINHSEPKIEWREGKDGKMEFLFRDSFDEMLKDFAREQPGLKMIPYDWTLYYLRQKALKEAISGEEMAWILLNFNAKRGYYQLREGLEQDDDEKDKDDKKQTEYATLTVKSIEKEPDNRKKDENWYLLTFEENDWEYKRSYKEDERMAEIGDVLDLQRTYEIDDNGEEVNASVRKATSSWKMTKVKTEKAIDDSHETLGSFIYNNLLTHPDQKIIGNKVQTVKRDLYKEELKAILNKQKEFHPELSDDELKKQCAEMLYSQNKPHREQIKDMCSLIKDDIIFYQRPLKSKKSTISNCPYEEYQKGDEIYHKKCAPRSNPYFQEFRLWQFIHNLKIKDRDSDIDKTDAVLQERSLDKEKLFDLLNEKKEIDEAGLMTLLGLKKEKINEYSTEKAYKYCWNYVSDNKYPCNETRHDIVKALGKAGIAPELLTPEKEYNLWHMLYSIKEPEELNKAIRTFARKNQWDEDKMGAAFAKFKTYKNEYASYSEKAIKKLLPLMRMGSKWSEAAIDEDVKTNINALITTAQTGEIINDQIKSAAYTAFKNQGITQVSDCHGMDTWLACYAVYGRHSEAKLIDKWNTPEDIDRYLKAFKQYSLRNPVVEQVVLETLRVVRDVWKQEGHIDEIHLEMGRDLNQTAEQRKRDTEKVTANQEKNERIKNLLREFAREGQNIESVRPDSPVQQEKMRIVEDGCINCCKNKKEWNSDQEKFLKNLSKGISGNDLLRYKKWIDQKYVSPYTGETIPLGKLFTTAYEIEHVIPKAKYFNDSYANKVICEAEVNKEKSDMLGHDFIVKCQGKEIEVSGKHKTVRILDVKQYEELVKKTYSNGTKLTALGQNLLRDEIPDGFSNSQLVDSQYIAKLVKTLLSNIVRQTDENGNVTEDGVTATHLITTNGHITDKLKNDWGLNDIWNELMLPRYKAVAAKDKDGRSFTAFTDNGHEIPQMPAELQKGFQKKRIDHRHHAMDALAIACANRNIVNFLSNNNASKDNHKKGSAENQTQLRYDLKNKVCEQKENKNSDSYKIKKPWETFTQDSKQALQEIMVSFKTNQRVLTRNENKYQVRIGNKTVLKKQEKGDQWAIRKSMHKETVFGEIDLQIEDRKSLKDVIKHPEWIKDKELKAKIKELIVENEQEKKPVDKIIKYFEDHKDEWQEEVRDGLVDCVLQSKRDTKDRYFATRKSIATVMDGVKTDKDVKKVIESITDKSIQEILRKHLEKENNNPMVAFSEDGLKRMNATIKELNGGKDHLPIYKVRIYEKAEKFAVGENGNKNTKFVEANTGTNLYFAIYQKEGKRIYETIDLHTVIDLEKKGEGPVPTQDAEGNPFVFSLSPLDLVYLPTAEEIEQGEITLPLNTERVYRMVKSSKKQCWFTPFRIANVIEKESEKIMEYTDKRELIKGNCVPIDTDRLGNILKVHSEYLPKKESL